MFDRFTKQATRCFQRARIVAEAAAVAAAVFGARALADGTPHPWGVRIADGASVETEIGPAVPGDGDADDFVFDAMRGQRIAVTVRALAAEAPAVALRPRVELLRSDGAPFRTDGAFASRLGGRLRTVALRADATGTHKLRVSGGPVDPRDPSPDAPRTTGRYTLSLRLGGVAAGQFDGAVPDAAHQLHFAVPGSAGAVVTTTLRWRGDAPALRGLTSPDGTPVGGFGTNARRTRTSLVVSGFRLGPDAPSGDYDLAFDTDAESPPSRVSLKFRVKLPKAGRPARVRQHADEPTLLAVSPASGPVGTTLTLSGTSFADGFASDANVFRAFVGRHELTSVAAVDAAAPTQLTGVVPAGVPLGTRDVVVETSTGQVAVLEDAFEVVAAPPDPDPDAKAPSVAHHPLEITNIKPSGAGGLDAQNRIFRAYPGIPYVIRAAVMGGSFPYTFSLSNVPAGMTVDARTGEVSWPNPTADATPTITVVDGALTQVFAT
ncbi:MAG: IPT/TIG domain-containing protein, partial [Planctomycetes bacterium]|nr:IPT/TIG domain-containing protein [Planctomycetota bacterium]